MRKNFLFLIGILFPFSLISQKTWTLQECLEYAVAHNPRILSLRMQTARDSVAWQESRMEILPQLEFTAGQGFQLGETFNVSTGVGQRKSSYTSFNLSAQASLFEGFAKHYMIRYRQALSQKSRYETSVEIWNLQTDIISLFYQILYDLDNLKISDELIHLQTQIVNIAEKLYREHLKPYDEYLSARTDLAALKRTYEEAKKQFSIHQARLTELLNLDTTLILPKPPSREPGFMISETLPTENLPHILAIKSQIKALEWRKKTEKSKRYPQLFIRYSYGSSYYHLLGEKDLIYNRETGQWEPFGPKEQFLSNQMHYVYAGIRIPLFQGFRVKQNLQMAEYEKRQAEYQLAERKRKLISLYRQWKTEAETAYRQWKMQEETVKWSKENLKLKEQKYKQNALPYIEWQKVRENHLQAELLLARYRWEAYMKYELLSRLFHNLNGKN